MTLVSFLSMLNTEVSAAGGLTQTCKFTSTKLPTVTCVTDKTLGARYRQVVIKNNVIVSYGVIIVCKNPSFPMAYNCSYLPGI